MPDTNLTRAEAEERARLVTVDAYDITVDLTATGATFPVTTVVHFRAAEVGASTFLDLIASTVRSVTLNGAALDPAVVYGGGRVALPNLAPTNTAIVEADMAYSHTGEGLHRFTDPVDARVYTYTQFEVADARRMIASFEQPDLKAPFTFHVITPRDWTVVSNQPTPTPTITGDQARWDFDPTPVMSTYLTAIIAGPYRRWSAEYTSVDGRVIPLGVYARESMARYVDADEIFDVTRRGFEFYERAFGVPYPYEKYDQSFVPEYNAGAMENIGAVTLAEANYIYRSRPVEMDLAQRANTILHEQAHMWFGDLVTMKWWNDLWLNESFAEFMAHFAAVKNTRWTNAWADFLAARKLVGYQQDQLPTTHPIMADIRDLADVEVNFDMITYAKGAAVLKQLVAWVGESAFLEGVHNYLVKHAYGNATLADFLGEVSAASGRDLAAWSAVWLEEAGVTTLRPVTTVRREGVYEAVAVAQEIPAVYARFADIPHRDLPPIQISPSLRPHHIELAGYRFGAGGLERVWEQAADITGALTPIESLAGAVVPDLLVINDRDLTYAKLRLDATSYATLHAHIGEITDELTRSLLWTALWDCLRDGELAARDYIELVLGALDQETNSTMLSALLARLRQCIEWYVTRDLADEVADDVAARLVAVALRADPGSDEQLQVFRAFALLACNPTQWDFLEEVLAGTSVVDGLVVDTDVRWLILTVLVAAGRADESAIKAELARDHTSSGAEAAAGARAAIPTLEAKRAAWHAAVHDEALPNAQQRAIIAWFGRASDPTLLREFAIEYFAVVEDVWEHRTREMSGNIVRALYPMWTLRDRDIDLLAMTDQWLDRLGARLPALRRVVLERREEIVRARVARARDARQR